MPSYQLKLSISEELLWRLEAMQKKHKARTTNIIASEVIEHYLDLWDEAETARKKKVIKQYVKARKQLK
jgi:predicted DNA-binding protein